MPSFDADHGAGRLLRKGHPSFRPRPSPGLCNRGLRFPRPIRELKGYQRVELAPGESKKVKFTLTGKDLAFWNIDMKHVAEPCELRVWVAPNSRAGSPVTMRIEP
ncbi:MAG: fibronectin type III-like domain-contianing protein [Armatimonadetes bacterium]|nr:fibronectin type III-like domain-contianing protein [Armatimonadota bacterium]